MARTLNRFCKDRNNCGCRKVRSQVLLRSQANTAPGGANTSGTIAAENQGPPHNTYPADSRQKSKYDKTLEKTSDGASRMLA